VTPYHFRFYDSAHIITGIACGPQDDKTSSPEVEVVDDINYHHVMIRLSPVHKGSWACCREICRIEENSVYMTCYRPTDCIRYVHSLHVLSEECILLGLIPCRLVDTLHVDPFLLGFPDVLCPVGDPLSGNGCGSPNHIMLFISFYFLFYLLILFPIQKVVLYPVKQLNRFFIKITQSLVLRHSHRSRTRLLSLLDC
jgi:hypothetical protein